MKVVVSTLDEAAFFTTVGAELLGVQGKYPENKFILNVSRGHVIYKNIGLVNYKKFCSQRRRLKRRGRRLAGLPEHFTGDRREGFQLQDIAIIK